MLCVNVGDKRQLEMSHKHAATGQTEEIVPPPHLYFSIFLSIWCHFQSQIHKIPHTCKNSCTFARVEDTHEVHVRLRESPWGLVCPNRDRKHGSSEPQKKEEMNIPHPKSPSLVFCALIGCHCWLLGCLVCWRSSWVSVELNLTKNTTIMNIYSKNTFNVSLMFFMTMRRSRHLRHYYKR